MPEFTIGQLLALGANEEENGYYSFTAEQVAIFLDQEEGIEIKYDAIERKWLPVEPKETFEKAVALIRLALRSCKWHGTYDYQTFQSIVRGKYPGVKFWGSPKAFLARGEHIRIHYWRDLNIWDVEKSRMQGRGHDLEDAIKNLAPISFYAPVNEDS